MSGTTDIDRIQRVVRSDEVWPPGLASVEVEPSTLWLRGRTDLLRAPRRIAIVGSRAPTDYGLVQAERFGRDLAGRGVCVISGLARGIDGAAHGGALEAGGDTIAVLGCGVDRPWPAGPLADRVARDGLLVSEFAPGTGPRRHHFPLRNRVLAALADAVLVVEAARASGSLITARWAADQGQAVFVIPGRVDHPLARGTLRLVREGATPVDSPAMLLADVYGEDAGSEENAGAGASTSEPERSIVKVLAGETLSAGEVSERAGIGIGAALASLTSLDLAGVVHRGPGGLYTLSPDDS